MPIATDSLQGSIALKGGRIDDLALVKFRETVDPKSPPIVLLSPSGTADPFYAEFGWTERRAPMSRCRTADTVWKQSGSGALSVGHPVTLTYDNGEGLNSAVPSRSTTSTCSPIKDEVANKGTAPVSLFPYALISRHGTPETAGYYILHEGLIGVLGDRACRKTPTRRSKTRRPSNFDVTNAWLGFTDKYWAATLLPDTDAPVRRDFQPGPLGTSQDLPDRLPARRADHRAGRDRQRQRAAVCRRQGSAAIRLRQGSSTSITSIC